MITRAKIQSLLASACAASLATAGFAAPSGNPASTDIVVADLNGARLSCSNWTPFEPANAVAARGGALADVDWGAFDASAELVLTFDADARANVDIPDAFPETAFPGFPSPEERQHEHRVYGDDFAYVASSPGFIDSFTILDVGGTDPVINWERTIAPDDDTDGFRTFTVEALCQRV